MSVYNDRTTAKTNENAITFKTLSSEAVNGRYYSHDQHKWESMGRVERFIRYIFFFIFDSVETNCMNKSWNSIENMTDVPKDIVERIEDLLLDSLYKTNPLSSQSGAICRVFCKVTNNQAIAKQQPLNQIDIQQNSEDRSFAIFCNKNLQLVAANSGYGQIDFYNTDCKKISTNDHDGLWEGNKRIGAIKLAVDYASLRSAMELSTGKDVLLTQIESNKDRVSLIFRNVENKKILAVSNLNISNSLFRPRLINWKTTVIDQAALDQKKISPLMISWSILKYSQHHHFPNPDHLKYVKGLPRMQTFRP